jgi:hypothetical protein
MKRIKRITVSLVMLGLAGLMSFASASNPLDECVVVDPIRLCQEK